MRGWALMRRIEVDFNTLTSEPVNLVKIAEVGSEREHELLPLQGGNSGSGSNIWAMRQRPKGEQNACTQHGAKR